MNKLLALLIIATPIVSNCKVKNPALKESIEAKEQFIIDANHKPIADSCSADDPFC